jgi:hypothetical protein
MNTEIKLTLKKKIISLISRIIIYSIISIMLFIGIIIVVIVFKG